MRKKKSMKKKIKILYIIPSLASGGAERFILDLIYNLDKENFEASLLLFNGKGFFYSEAVKEGLKVKVYNKFCRLDFFNFFKIYNYIKKEKVDIVHTQLGGDIYGKIAAKLAGVKNIISTEQNVLKNDSKLVLFLKKMTSKFSKKIIAISSEVKKDIINKYAIPEDRVALIFNGIDLNKFSCNLKKNNKKDKIIIGSIGRLSEQKNFSLLFRALASFPDINFECLIVGEGRLRLRLEKEIRELSLENKVYLLGRRKEVQKFLLGLDFFVLPSKWEGLGLVVLEAGLAKLAVLASNTGGIKDIIKDRETGILFENNNLDDLKEKLSYFFDASKKENLDLLGENLHEFVEEEFDIKKITRKYESLYLNL
jgi:glycosyltransferase involved in cell wall biosynthesis